LYLDDRRKFARLVAYLIPKKGLRKFYLTGKRQFDAGWVYPPSKNYVNRGTHVPNDLRKFDIEVQNYALFVHGSSSYYQKRFPKSFVDSLIQANIDLASYEQPLRALIKHGLQIVRVGTHVDDLPDLIKNLPVIDYARGPRDEASELWLYENCKLLVSVTNGAFWFSRRFNRPTIITNSQQFIHRYFSTFYTPSLFRDIKTNELLSFRQMNNHRENKTLNDIEAMRSNGVQIIPNSSSTLTASINETLDYANGLTHIDSADKNLLDKYNNFCQEFGLVFNENTTRPTISFLREYSHLLD
jgi:putative glycosyltransferase (TIGR04372 family)